MLQHGRSQLGQALLRVAAQASRSEQGVVPSAATAVVAASGKSLPPSTLAAFWWRQLRRPATSSAPAQAAAEASQQLLAAEMQRARRMTVPVGGLAGIVGSVAGSGGAAVIVPLISKACGSIPQRVISGTSLAAVLTTALVSTATYTANGCVDLPASLLISPPALLLAPLGARYTSRLNCNQLKRLLGYFLLAAAPLIPLKAWLFSQRGKTSLAAGEEEDKQQQQPQPQQQPQLQSQTHPVLPQQVASPAEGASTSGSSGSTSSSWAEALNDLRQRMPDAPTAVALATTGALSGFASGLLGIGGGTIATPMVALLMPYAQATVLGTSLLAMVPPTAAALLQHQRLGNIDWRMAAGLAVGSVLGGAVGSEAAVHAPPGTLEAVFTVAMLALARMTLKGAR